MRLREHVRAQLDSGQRRPCRVVLEIESSSHCDLENLASGATADPGPGVAEEDSVEKGHVFVVTGRLLVPESLPPGETVRWIDDHRSVLSAGSDGCRGGA